MSGEGMRTVRDSTTLIRTHISLRRVGGKLERTTKWFQRDVVGVRDRRGGAQVETDRR